jgi:hypothetical protein
MESHRIDKLNTIFDEIQKTVDKKVATKLEIDKCRRIIQRLNSFSTDCEECYQHFIELENHLIQLAEKVEHQVEDDDFKNHKQIIANVTSHLEKQHKLVTSGYYLSVYMSIGMSIGLVFGLLIFDNLALGLPIGMGIGVAIGAGLDEDAKKKGMTL